MTEMLLLSLLLWRFVQQPRARPVTTNGQIRNFANDLSAFYREHWHPSDGARLSQAAGAKSLAEESANHR